MSGEVFDIGYTTRVAVSNFKAGVDLKRCGGKNINNNGNGSLMRILPLAFTDCDDETIDAISSLTHAHDISKTACRIYIHIARQLLDNKPQFVRIVHAACIILNRQIPVLLSKD